MSKPKARAAMRDGHAVRTALAATRAGFIGAEDPARQRQAVVDMLLVAGEPLRHTGPYDFGKSALFSRLFTQGRTQFFGDGFARTPPPDLLFLQRKFVGTFLFVRALAGQGRPGAGVLAASLGRCARSHRREAPR